MPHLGALILDKRRSHHQEYSPEGTSMGKAKVEQQSNGESRRLSGARYIEVSGGDVSEAVSTAYAI